MKTSFLISAASTAILLTFGCETLDEHCFNIKSRAEATGWKAGGTGKDIPSGSALFISAVDFPSGYDWQRDSAAGMSEGRIILFRNYEPVLEIPTGAEQCISTDPDTHHLIGGNLYTEYTNSEQTVIKCNGKELFRYEGREFLKGLMIREDGVWTLGQRKGGNGFSLRCNGKAVLQKNTGDIFGNLGVTPGGALYEDRGDICFAYSVSVGALQSQIMVTGGEEYGYFMEGTVHDIRRMDGEICILREDQKDGRTYLLRGERSTEILPATEKPRSIYLISAEGSYRGLAGTIIVNRREFNAIYILGVYYVRKEESADCFVYSDSNVDNIFTVEDRHGIITLARRKLGNDLYVSEDECYFYSRNCFCHNGAAYFLALTPKDKREYPRIESTGGRTEIKVYGYISAVEWVPAATR